MNYGEGVRLGLVQATEPILRRYLRAKHGQALKRIEVVRFLPKPFSSTIFLRAVCDLTSRDFVVKQVLPSNQNDILFDAAGRAQVEYDVLEMLYPRFVDVNGCAVPQPIASVPEHNALIMAFIEGTLLDSSSRTLRRVGSRKCFTKLCNHFMLCGRWLQHFQSYHITTSADTDSLNWLRTFADDRLQMIQIARSSLFDDTFIDTAKDLLNHQRSELANLRIPVIACHGDFGPWNVLVNSEGVTVLDFFGYQDAPATVDAVRMLSWIDSQKMNPTVSAAKVEQMRRCFLDGLGTVDAVPCALARYNEICQRIANVAGTLSQPGKTVWRRYLKACYLKHQRRWFFDDARRYTYWLA